MAFPPIPSHDDLLTAVRRYSVLDFLTELAKVSSAQLSGHRDPAWPHPWTIAELARESIAYGNKWRSAPVTKEALHRLSLLALNQADPMLVDADGNAIDSLMVRVGYQQIPFGQFQPLGELARLIEVCDRGDAEFATMGLEVISDQTWVDLLGMPLRTWARAVFAIYSVARVSNGFIDPAGFADPAIARFGLTSDQLLTVFHKYLAAEMSDLKAACAANRDADPARRRLDFNPLVATPFVSMGAGRYLAPSLHLVEQRISLSALFYLGVTKYRTKFARDLGKLVEAYVGRQLAQLDLPTRFTGERTYGKHGEKTSDWLGADTTVTLLVESKAARIALPGRRDFTSYTAAVNRDVGDSLGNQVPVTVGLVTSGDSVFADLKLPGEVHAFITTAEPFLMINSPHYRTLLPDPGCPYAVLSLGDLEWFVAAVLAGADFTSLVRSLTDPTAGEAQSVIAAAAGTDSPENPMLLATFDDFVAVLPAA